MKRGFILIVFILLISPVFAKEILIPESFEIEKILNLEPSKEVYFYSGNRLIASSDGSLEYKYQDRLGSDIESKSLPFGEPILIENRFSFSGKELDQDLYYFGVRYYNSNLGRFISIDPVAENHPYTYVDNNPLNFVDLDGRIGVRIHGLEGQDTSYLQNAFKSIPDSLYPNPVSKSGIDIEITRRDLGENIGGIYNSNSVSVNPSYLFNLLDSGKPIPSNVYGSAMIMLFLDAFHETVHWNLEAGVINVPSPPQRENFPDGVSPYDYGYMIKTYMSKGEYDSARAYLGEFRNFYLGVIDDKISEERTVRNAELNAIEWLSTFGEGFGESGKNQLIGRTKANAEFEENYYLGFKTELSTKFDTWQSVIDSASGINK